MKVLTLAEAAEFMRVSPYTLRELARSKEVPGAKVGGEWRFTDESLEAHMRKLVSGEKPAIASPEIPPGMAKRAVRRQPKKPPSLSANARI